MPGWAELREDLRRIAHDAPGALMEYPDPDSDRADGESSSVRPAAGAVDPFPKRDVHAAWRALPEPRAESLGLGVEPVSPLTVPSGDSTTAAVRVLNHTEVPRYPRRTGHPQSAVVDGRGASRNRAR